jgi:hypothetical protein
MSQSAVQVGSEVQKSHPWKRTTFSLLILIVTYLSVWVSTQAHFMADTNVYTQAILRHQNGGADVDYRLMTGNPFWDFGHILWRPVGWLCFVIARPITQLFAPQSQRAGVLFTLLGINFLASFACVLFFFLMAKKVTGHEWAAAVAVLGLFSADAFLDYAHSGNAYVVGLACLMAGMYFSWFDKRTENSFSGSLGAVLLALAVLFWLPYVFVLPAVLLGPFALFGDQDRRRTLRMLVVCAVVGISVYALAVTVVGIRNLGDLKQWILASGHGQIQPGGFRAAARLAFAVPRSFIYMGDDGMWLKRYLLHDPYAPVTMGKLFSLSLWKLALFYVAVGVVSLELLRAKPGRAVLVLLVSAAVPIFLFAIFIFEAGSIERYLPLFPFVFLATATVFAGDRAKQASKLLLLFMLAVMCAVNVQAMRRGTLEPWKTAAVARIHDLIPLLGPNSLVLALNEQDSLAQFRQNFPLDPINLDGQWRLYDVLEINTERLDTWREDLATRIVGTWDIDGIVWLPLRFLSARPRPEWNWVEGDDTRIHWGDLPAFFSQFETGRAVGGDDGFVLLLDTPRNRQILRSLR